MTEPSVPTRTVTAPPGHHWFAYYDKLQFDPSDRRILGMAVDFQHRSPTPDDVIRVGMIDLADNDRWTELGASTAWCWQQGCMLQWLPGSEREVIWNERADGHYVARILDVTTGQSRVIPHPVYALSPDGRWAVTPDFRRIQDTRPGYGYAGFPDPRADHPAPGDAGIWRVDLANGSAELIVTLAQVSAIPNPNADTRGAKHWFNHLLVSPDGSRFIFLHRWLFPDKPGQFHTRMLTCSPDGSDLHVVEDSGNVSHFIWRDAGHILAWSRHGETAAFHLYTDRSEEAVPVGQGVMTHDGHVSYLPDRDWIVCDTYPWSERRQELYLFHVPTGRKTTLTHFPAPVEYKGEWRCDLHPRHSRGGTLLTVDAPVGDAGRQIVLLDIAAVVKA